MKILIIEDEKDLREVMTRSLEKERFVVETAVDYPSALQKINDYDYDCILLDIMLPGGSGLSILEELKKETRTMIVYEAPHHLVATLEDLYGALGNRKITICRELTKKFESAFQTTFEEALAHYETEEPKGECVIVIAGKPVEEIREEEIRAWEEMPIEEHMEHYLSQGMDKKEAMKAVAKDRGISKRDVYQQLL